MAMVRPNERRFHFEPHAAAEATASNHLGHAKLFARHQHDWKFRSVRDAETNALGNIISFHQSDTGSAVASSHDRRVSSRR
jgi:hypothetical protein